MISRIWQSRQGTIPAFADGEGSLAAFIRTEQSVRGFVERLGMDMGHGCYGSFKN